MSVSKLYIDHKVAASSEAAIIRSHLKNVSCEIVNNSIDVYREVLKANDPVQNGKETLFLTKNKGSFIKNCPGTRNYICCGYKILHIGTYCYMDCSYCILQSYFHPPLLQYYLNHDDLIQELDRLFAAKKISRIGTGEFTDSLIWESWTDMSNLLVSKFAGHTNSVLELKTKTVSIKRLKSLDHNRKTIISWSLNTESIINSEERNTASLSERLAAAATCESWGYPLSFHFDPIIIYDGCEKDYKEVIKQLFLHVSAENIVWISLGTFRFMPQLKPVIQKRFPASKIVYGEFISGLDNKMRYFKPIRIEIYNKIVSCIKDYAPDVLIYFCMEDEKVWEKVLGFKPSDRGGLPHMLDKAAAFHCMLA